ncbi:MAG: glutamate--cysteine ligase [Hyphomicrobiales bacterium]|nr:glutamate--cysteine ligase [Hyphomicrobiales bacterium]
MQQAGYRVQLTAPGINEEMPLETAEGSTILFSPLSRQDDQLVVNGLVADLILLNNDMTGGTPEIVSGIRQPILPDPSLGWYKRRKTTHFDAYNDVVRLFGAEFGIDHWLLSTYTHKCGKINFRERNGLECVAMGVERTIARIARKYEEYGVKETPYVFIKSNYGTYGMGIMTARNAEDVLSINKKARHSMDVIKQGVSNAEVIIQEGVPTADRINGQVAESLIYMVGGAPVGCNYRLNEHRDAYSNLNSPGMTFGHACEGDKEAPDALHGGCPVLGLIAKLAHLAAVRECYDYAYAI